MWLVAKAADHDPVYAQTEVGVVEASQESGWGRLTA